MLLLLENFVTDKAQIVEIEDLYKVYDQRTLVEPNPANKKKNIKSRCKSKSYNES